MFLWDSPNYGILNISILNLVLACGFGLPSQKDFWKPRRENGCGAPESVGGIQMCFQSISFEWETSEDADDVTVFSQQYLRNFFCVMMSSCSSSPLRTDEFELHLSKHAVCSISPFFKKGVFDYSSHGTGWYTHSSTKKHSFT